MKHEIHNASTSPFRLYAFATILLSGIAALLLARYLIGPHAFAFVDVGSDSFLQFYPMQTEFVRQMHEDGVLGWSHRIGLGTYFGPAMDPFYLLGLLWPVERQLDARAWIYLAKIVSSGLLFLAYLREIRIPNGYAVLGALCYALNGYLVINGQWDPHGTEVPIYALLLFAMERCLRTGNAWLLVMAGVLVGLHNPFSLYTCSVFCALYVIARRLIGVDVASFKQFAASAARMAGFYCLGLMLAAPLLFPNLAALFDSPRVGGATSMQAAILRASLVPNDHQVLFSMVAGLFDKSILGIGSNYTGQTNFFEAPGFYVGLLPLLLVTQLLDRRCGRAERRLGWLILVVAALYFLFPLFRFATYGFGHVAFRLSTLWLSLLLLIGGIMAMQRIGREGLAPGMLVTTATALAALLIWVGLSAKANSDGARVAMLLMLLVTYTVIAIAFDRTRFADVVPLALGGLLLLELFVTSYGNLNDRVAVQKNGTSSFGSYNDGTPQALAWLRANRDDFDLSRMDKSYNSVFLCDSLIQDYNGVASYFFHGKALTAINDGFGMTRPVPSISYIGHADIPGLLSVLGVKYLLNRSGHAPPGWRLAHQVASISIFENPSAEGIAQFRTRSVRDTSVMKLPPEQRVRVAHDAVIVDARVAARIRLPIGTTTTTKADPKRIGSVHLLKWEDDKLVATVRARTAGMVVLVVPFNRGWQAEVDGHNVQPLPVNFGFMGVEVESGQHAIKLRYRPLYRLLGWYVFTAALLLLAAVSYWRLRRKRETYLQINGSGPRHPNSE